MSKTIDRIIIFAMIVGMMVFTATLLTSISFGSAPSGLQSVWATTSQVTVGPQKPNVASSTVDVFLNSPNCASRVVTTYASEIKLLFNGTTMISSTTANPSATFGHTQLASTTVVYDSGQWGCGFVSAYGFSSTTLTVSEFR